MTSASGPAWPSDQLVASAQRGDATAIAALVSGSHRQVHRLAAALCATPEDAEDAAQQALIILFRTIGTPRAISALSSWLFQIVRTEVRCRPPHSRGYRLWATDRLHRIGPDHRTRQPAPGAGGHLRAARLPNLLGHRARPDDLAGPPATVPRGWPVPAAHRTAWRIGWVSGSDRPRRATSTPLRARAGSRPASRRSPERRRRPHWRSRPAAG